MFIIARKKRIKLLIGACTLCAGIGIPLSLSANESPINEPQPEQPENTEAETIAQVQIDPITSYLDAIAHTEAENSAFAIELADLYLSLGRTHQNRNELEDAKRAFQRGMQIERVNNGLDSLSQTPYLYSIADIESHLGNWKGSQKALEDLYLINAGHFGKDNPRMLPVLNNLLDWYLNSYYMRSPSAGYNNLVISERIANRIGYILEEEVGLDHPDAPDYFRRISFVHYFIADHLKKYGEPSESGFSISAGENYSRSAKPTTSKLHFRLGRSALEKVVESLDKQENSSVSDQALAIAELGDWYLVFGQHQSAKKAYNLAFEVLGEAEESDQLREKLFGQPQPIKFSAPENTTGNTIKKTESKLNVSMNISPYGTPENIEILNPPEDLEKKAINRVEKLLRSQRFRPRLVGGEPVATQAYILQHAITAQGSKS